MGAFSGLTGVTVQRYDPMIMKRFGQPLIDAVCPNWCELCQSRVYGSDSLCADCTLELRKQTRRPFCHLCGETIPLFGASAPCPNCPKPGFPFDQVIRVAAYEGAWRLLIQRYKFKRQRRLLNQLAEELSGAIQRSEVFDLIDACTWTPTCWRHRAVRPFYPTEHIAARTAAFCRIPRVALLGRTFSPHQTGQSATARIANVKGKFHMLGGRRLLGARICLIDDVLTTGATAGQCAKVLKQGGAAEVYVAVLARTANHPAAISSA